MDRNHIKAFIIGGMTSGVGKTTIATGLMGALCLRNLKVQPFKTGPDYIDPSYHTWVTGVPSRNLDTWMLPHEALIELFRRAMTGKDIGIIEGVMGFYDGRFPTSDEGSTAELAKLLNVPVLLVLDSRKAARSLAAIVGGYQQFDPAVRIGGIILNGIGSASHWNLCREAIEHYCGIPVMGYLPRRDDLVLPERHLGLIPAIEEPASQLFLNRLIEQCQATFDLEQILQIAEKAEVPEVQPALFPANTQTPSVNIAVALDKAFSFYYQDNLDLLAAWGANIIPFSPLRDQVLPKDTAGLFLGGGFPELYAAELAANVSIKSQIRKAIDQGMPVYAECGGLMYLGKSIRDFQGQEFEMVGTLPLESKMDKPRRSLGYRIVKALEDNPILKNGEVVRGHEFHWSSIDINSDIPRAYELVDRGPGQEGFRKGELLASYIHLHFGGLPSIAPRFVAQCKKFREK